MRASVLDSRYYERILNDRISLAQEIAIFSSGELAVASCGNGGRLGCVEGFGDHTKQAGIPDRRVAQA